MKDNPNLVTADYNPDYNIGYAYRGKWCIAELRFNTDEIEFFENLDEDAKKWCYDLITEIKKEYEAL